MPNWSAKSHTYEELRTLVVDELLKGGCNQFAELEEKVGQALLKQSGSWPQGLTGYAYQGAGAYLNPNDGNTILEIFWDLFRQGVITLGLNASNPQWPWFRLSRFGENIRQTGNVRFHDTASYVEMIKTYDPNLSDAAIMYLEEAAAAFYADCVLAATVMLGVAAEAEFLRMVDIAVASTKHGKAFASVAKEQWVKGKITKFQLTIAPLLKSLPRECTDDMDTNLSMIQSVLRIARNDAGHPSGNPAPPREQVYVNMQLFGPFARQLAALRKALA